MIDPNIRITSAKIKLKLENGIWVADLCGQTIMFPCRRIDNEVDAREHALALFKLDYQQRRQAIKDRCGYDF
jgi:hypothetical protein